MREEVGRSVGPTQCPKKNKEIICLAKCWHLASTPQSTPVSSQDQRGLNTSHRVRSNSRLRLITCIPNSFGDELLKACQLQQTWPTGKTAKSRSLYILIDRYPYGLPNEDQLSLYRGTTLMEQPAQQTQTRASDIFQMCGVWFSPNFTL